MRDMQAKAQDKKGAPMRPTLIIRLAIPLAAALSLAACETAGPTSQYYRPTPSQAVKASSDAIDTPEWMRQRQYRDGGPVPPMEENRSVNEQPCTEGVALAAGNLKCK